MNDVITYWNNAAEEFYGWPRRQAIGRVAHELTRAVFPAPLPAINAELLRTGRWDGELIQSKRDGTQMIVESRWSLQRDARGRASAILETNTDITLRKQAEDALRRSEAYLAEAQRLSRTGSFGWNLASGRIYWSQESRRIFDIPRQVEPTIKLILERTHPDDAGLVEQTIERARQNSEGFDVEHRLLMPDGKVKHVHALASPARNAAGEVELIGALMDVTAVKQAQEAMQQAEAELAHVTRLSSLGELTASIAHEVNQPLAAIITGGEACLRWLDRDPPPLDEVRGSVQRMIADGRRASEVIRRIRTLSRKADPQKSRLDLNEVVEEAILLVQHQIIRRRVVLRRELAPGLPPVLGDRVQLQQLIINLLINGIQAMEAVHERPRLLQIRSRRPAPDEVLVAVEDSGTGIEPGQEKRLFDAFFTTKPEGMGMGLSICRSIVEAHGGRIRASRNAGPGATFEFVLPSDQGGLP
jgi:PAS domain S-box-containing protein